MSYCYSKTITTDLIFTTTEIRTTSYGAMLPTVSWYCLTNLLLIHRRQQQQQQKPIWLHFTARVRCRSWTLLLTTVAAPGRCVQKLRCPCLKWQPLYSTHTVSNSTHDIYAIVSEQMSTGNVVIALLWSHWSGRISWNTTTQITHEFSLQMYHAMETFCRLFFEQNN